MALYKGIIAINIGSGENEKFFHPNCCDPTELDILKEENLLSEDDLEEHDFLTCDECGKFILAR